MAFMDWLKQQHPLITKSWEKYLNEIIEEGCIVDHTDIEVYMGIAYKAGQESVKEGK